MGDWATKPLGEVATFQRGFDLPYHARKSGDVPVVSSAGATDYHRHAMVDAPGVVTGRYGTIGELFFLTTAFWPLNTTLYVRDFHGNDPRFVFYLLHRFDFKSFSGKSGVPGVNRNDLHAEMVMCPDEVDEQRAIATVLKDVDELLEGLDRLITKKRDLKQATMQQLLTGETRLPGFDGKWETKPISQLLTYERPDKYIVARAEYSTSGGVPVLTANKSFVLGFTHEDFGICRDLPAIVFDDFTTDSKYVTFPFKVKSSAIKILRPRDSKVNMQFVHHRMQLIRFPLGEHKRYYISEYQHIELPIPSSDEQEAIARSLADMCAEIEALEQRRAKTANLKQAMMQELLTGKTRLVIPEVKDA